MKNTKLFESSWWLNDAITNEFWCYADKIFSFEELDKIIKIGESGEPGASPLEIAKIGGGKVETSTRACSVSFLNSQSEDAQWIYPRLAGSVINMNDNFFNFDLSRIESLQFTKYESNHSEFYEKHVDSQYKAFSPRKLSFSVILSDPSEYEGGDLLFHLGSTPSVAPRERGKVIFFPSYILHEVTPVTKGTRYSLVGWVSGPPFR